MLVARAHLHSPAEHPPLLPLCPLHRWVPQWKKGPDDDFFVMCSEVKYYNMPWNDNGKLYTTGTRPEDYITSVIGNRTLQWLDKVTQVCMMYTCWSKGASTATRAQRGTRTPFCVCMVPWRHAPNVSGSAVHDGLSFLLAFPCRMRPNPGWVTWQCTRPTCRPSQHHGT